MIQKRDTCKYCGQKMESQTAKKQFCSNLHRVYWNREQKTVKVTDLTTPNKEVKPVTQPPASTNYSINTMPEGLNWKEQIEWKRQNKK